MKKIFIVLYLIFASLFLIMDFYKNFKELKLFYYSLNPKKYFKQKKIYYLSKIDGASEGGNYQGAKNIQGYFWDGQQKKKASFDASDSQFKKYLKNDKHKGDSIYFEVWHQKDLNHSVLKMNSNSYFSIQNYLKILFTYVFFLPGIFYLIKLYK